MTDWTTITDTQIDPKAPVTSELMTALRDNPSAITEGVTGAPRIYGAAIARDFGSPNLPVVTVAAGNNLSRQGEGYKLVNSSTTSTSYVVGVRYTIKSYSGSLRFKITHTAGTIGPVTANSILAIYKNDVLIQQYSVSGTSARVNDVSISVGDVIEWRHRTSAAAFPCSISAISVSADDPYVQQPAYRQQSEEL